MMKWTEKVQDRRLRWSFYLLLGFSSLFLTFNLHRNTGTLNWNSEIWADCAGYYIYLPATFLYGYDYERFPEGIDEKTGYGFRLDPDRRVFMTKYSSGVALLVSPFFLGAQAISAITGIPSEGGFSPLFHRAMDIAGVFYLLLGLFFLQRLLDRHCRRITGYLLVFFLYAGTNLYFFTLRSPLMPHVYSFFLCASMLYFFDRYIETREWKGLVPVSLALALAVLIRPTSILLTLILPFWNLGRIQSLPERMKTLLAPRTVLLFVLVLAAVMTPQLFLWKYMTGKFMLNAYQGESFSNWAEPRMAEVWFAPLNGLFLYNPIWIFFIAGIIWAIVRKKANGILAGAFFLMVTYMCASWHSWYFGCGYGQRQFIDYLPLIAFPAGFLTDRLTRLRSRLPFLALVVFLFLASFYNIRMITSWTGCFAGSSWDWPQFGRELSRAGLLPASKERYVYFNDFENDVITWGMFRSDSVSFSGNFSLRSDSLHEFNGKKSLYLFELSPVSPRYADVSFRIWSPSAEGTGAKVVCTADRSGTSLSWQALPIDPVITGPGSWDLFHGIFTLPDSLRWDDQLSLYIWNPTHRNFYIDDLSIIYSEEKASEQ